MIGLLCKLVNLHLHSAPKRLQQLSTQTNSDQINSNFPEVEFNEAVSEDCPDSEARRKDITRC